MEITLLAKGGETWARQIIICCEDMQNWLQCEKWGINEETEEVEFYMEDETIGFHYCPHCGDRIIFLTQEVE